MAYSTITNVREILGIDTYMPEDSIITNFISIGDSALDQKCGGSAYLTTQAITYTGDGRFLELEYDFREIKNVYINNEELLEYNERDMLDDGECDYSSDTVPNYWNESESTGDTLTWDANYSYSLSKSLKIEKGGALESSWNSDDVETVSTEGEYMARARIKVDANSSGAVYLRLEFRDTDGTSLKTFDSEAVTVQVTQPSSASVISAVSDSALDIQNMIVEGTVNGVDDSEVITISGTTSVSTTKSFSDIKGIKLDTAAAGTITITSNAAVVTNATFSAGDILKEDWQLIQVGGASPHDTESGRVHLRCTSSTGSCWGDSFRLLERNWKPRPTARETEFMANVSNGSSIRISYLRLKLHPLVPIISRKIAALYTLAHITGGDTAGVNFEDLKAGKYGGAALFSRFKYLRDEIAADLRSLSKMDHSLPDVILGEFTS